MAPLFPMLIATVFWWLGSGDAREIWWSNELPMMAFSTLVLGWLDVERCSHFGWFDPQLRRRASNRGQLSLEVSAMTDTARVMVAAFAVMSVALTVAFYAEKFRVGGFTIAPQAKATMAWVLTGLILGGLFVRGYVQRLTRGR